MMYSLNFPNFLSETNNVISNKEATRSNMRLLLGSERLTHFGDPYFGARLKRVMFEQQNVALKDLMIDELYTTLVTFMPQIYVTRKSITLESRKNELFATIQYWNKIDGTSDLYTIKLMDAQPV